MIYRNTLYKKNDRTRRSFSNRLTIEEASNLLNVPSDVVRLLVVQQKIPFLTDQHSIFFNPDELGIWLKGYLACQKQKSMVNDNFNRYFKIVQILIHIFQVIAELYSN